MRIEFHLSFWYYHYNTGHADNGWRWGKRVFSSESEARQLMDAIKANPESEDLVDDLLNGDGYFDPNGLNFQLAKVTYENIPLGGA